MNAMSDGVIVMGYVDGMEGAYVAGWATRSDGGECKITVRTPEGKIVGKGNASHARPDLSALGYGKTNFAFRVPIPDIGSHRVLIVFADDVELGPSPVEVGPGLFRGNVMFHSGRAEGWVTELTADFSPPLVTIQDGRGRTVSQGFAAFHDDGLDPYFTPAEYSLDLADFCFGCEELRLTALANGVAFATAECNLSLKGTLEALTESRCSGWLFSPDAPARALSLDIFVDNELAAQTECDLKRADVSAAFPECAAGGFAVDLPPRRMAPTDLATISIRLRGSDLDLLDGPHVIGSTAAVVTAARRAAQLITATTDKFSEVERSVVQAAISDLLIKTRRDARFMTKTQYGVAPRKEAPRLNIIIPVYRNVPLTAACVRSVLAHRAEAQDRVVLVNDRSPEPEMAELLEHFAGFPNVVLLNNQTNLGFVKSINRGFNFCDSGDVLLLNSDTEVFPGVLEEMWRVANSSGNIGTVTAISNNATIFSYPHASLRAAELDDIGWPEVAAEAMSSNRGLTIDMPTGHGFCLLVRRDVLDRVGKFDESFGRGYGEENDFCARAADLGYRNVVAPGSFVMHRESASFLEDKDSLLKTNSAILNSRYPEYTPIIMEAERTDPLRGARWPLDVARLQRVAAAGVQFVVVVSNWLGGGTKKAIEDSEESVGYGPARKLGVMCREDGYIELRVKAPAICAIFAPNEVQPLFALLSAIPVARVIVHQLLGFTSAFSSTLSGWVRGRDAVFYAHDFYPLCPRVTMIDAAGEFCDVAGVDVCARCIAIGGMHEASKTADLGAAEHRILLGAALANFKRVVAPSASTAGYYKRAFPAVGINVEPHPEPGVNFPSAVRDGSNDEVILLGALGPHKGSRKLLEIAQRAKLVRPSLRFRVVGYTDIDDKLKALGNVLITGPYKPAELARNLRAARGHFALFLSVWPETYSYTLSEVVAQGFIPFVPNIGAPADRVRESGFGVIFSFPVDPVEVVRVLDDFSAGRIGLHRKDASPADFNARPVERRAAEAKRTLKERLVV